MSYSRCGFHEDTRSQIRPHHVGFPPAGLGRFVVGLGETQEILDRLPEEPEGDLLVACGLSADLQRFLV